ncbi:MAG TPA: NBR1-Ig-like domain-containing protein [Anaerolineales bacterium]|nr:NBR1-Ig-like domain-containing protein [Anaerolineales bacterium]
MKQSNKRALFIFMAGIILLAACAPAPASTQDPAEIQQQIQDAVAMTVAAQEAEQEAQAAVANPTNTPLPTQTEAGPASPTPLIPTATPFTVVPPTLVPSSSDGGGGGGGVAVTPLDYDCTSRDRLPYDNTYFNSNKEFDIKWTIVNTGSKAWDAGKDVKYFSGPQMSTTTHVQLPAMAPGDTFVVNLDAFAPQKKGFHVMTWVVEGALCYPYVAIIVE